MPSQREYELKQLQEVLEKCVSSLKSQVTEEVQDNMYIRTVPTA